MKATPVGAVFPPQAGPPKPLTVVDASRLFHTPLGAGVPLWLPQGLAAALSELSVPPLDGGLALNKGIDDPATWVDPKTSGCKRIPDHFKLVDRLSGECVSPSCRATNQCEHCRKQRAALLVEMLILDAMNDAPTLALLLTARKFPEGDELRRTYAQIAKALRRRWPQFRWFVPKEQQREGRIHVHPICKGIPDDDASMREAYEITTRIWTARHDAIAYPYGSEEIRRDPKRRGPQGIVRLADAGGFVRYLHKELAHSLKSAQALPLGFRGHRTTHSRPRKDAPGYFILGTKETEDLARRSLRERRLAYRLTQQGITGQHAQDLITAELERPRDWAMTGVGYPISQHKRLEGECQSLYKTPASVPSLGTEEQLPQFEAG